MIEHFDWVHCKYVLSEWFRVLNPGGTLVLETPDLKRSFQKFMKGNIERKKNSLQWIYGIDSRGLQHKAGFTFPLLKHLLGQIGFEEISLKEAKTHTYEPGMRIECKKPSKWVEDQLFACFRKRLKRSLDINDSYILLPLETWVMKCGAPSREERTIGQPKYCLRPPSAIRLYR